LGQNLKVILTIPIPGRFANIVCWLMVSTHLHIAGQLRSRFWRFQFGLCRTVRKGAVGAVSGSSAAIMLIS
jgi:hypothetical protein